MPIPEHLPLMHVAALLREFALQNEAVATLPAPEREAAAFSSVLAHLPVAIHPEEPLAGDWHWRFAALPLREQVARALDRPVPPPGAPSVLQLLDERFCLAARWTPAHTCLDYEQVISRGLAGVLADLETAPPAAGPEQAAVRRAMRVALHGVIALAHHLADLAEAQGLPELAASCRHVPEHPARTVREALQAIWICHLAVGVSEYSEASLSLGRLDQYLYPLFAADCERGVPQEELRALVADLWRKLNRFGDPACAVNLGGLDEAGCDLWNPLTDLLVAVTKELRLPAPLLAARVHDQLSPQAFDALLCPELLTIGQPTFYGEDPCRQALVRRGVPPAEACGFSVNSCMGLVVPGAEIADMWGIVVNLLLPLELALGGGQPFAAELPLALQTPPAAGYADFEALYAQWEAYLGELLACLVAWQDEANEWAGRERPNPFLSALTRDCLARGQDRTLGGARYHTITVEGFGWANTADALTAIKRLVFDTGAYRLDELALAAREDYAGHEDLLAAVRACPKYGNAEAEADAMAARVTATFAALAAALSSPSPGGAASRAVCGIRPPLASHANRYYVPSYHTLNAHLAAGAKLPASLDGRRAGQPLGKNAGPLPQHRRGSLTALLLSASAIDQGALSGGQALDISLDPKLLASAQDRHKLQALLRTYFSRGGLQIQVNGVGAQELREAIAEPQAHRDLIVRIAGYSARFTELGRAVQEEMVERFEVGL